MALPIAVIPSRYGAVRFPGKPLALLAGRPLVQHVWQRCQESQAFGRVIVATDDTRIAETVKSFGGEVVLTSSQCANGTERVAEVARSLASEDVFVNVQGDEPLVHPEALQTLTSAFADATVNFATLVRVLDEAERPNPNVVKVVLAANGDALYFSRADIPFLRGPPPAGFKRWAHLGLYGYRRTTLLRLASLPPSPLEQAESLEQLRALENGIPIRCLVTTHRSFGIDTPEDLAKAEAQLRQAASR
ncbi:MAG: 3-deoxy-manno-octulosonate cytidylyltransferase [Myxococcaceae bacterium]